MRSCVEAVVSVVVVDEVANVVSTEEDEVGGGITLMMLGAVDAVIPTIAVSVVALDDARTVIVDGDVATTVAGGSRARTGVANWSSRAPENVAPAA